MAFTFPAKGQNGAKWEEDADMAESMAMRMTREKKELVEAIEAARERMNRSIDERKDYSVIYQYSVELDRLLNQYIVAGF